MKKSFKYRVYPTKSQETKLLSHLELCRQLYNASLQQRNQAYKNKKKSISKYDQTKELPELKKQCPEFKFVYSQVLQDAQNRLDKTFKSFFRRVKSGQEPGYPRYKGKNRYNSMTYPQIDLKVKSDKVYIPNIGWIRFDNHREIQGLAKTLTVSKNINNKWFISISCDQVPDRVVPSSTESIGIDPGIKTFLTLSDGSKIENPQFMKEEQTELSRLQRKQSKFKNKSMEYKKYSKRIRRLYERVDNKKTNFLFQTARKLVDKYETICLEDLEVSGINIKKEEKVGTTKRKNINRKLSDLSISRFKMILKNKVEETGSQRTLVLVDPKNTTKTCSNCEKVKEISIAERIYQCGCGLVLGRDHNSAINILRLGLQSLDFPRSRRL